ncbi:MAG TPA: glycosyltransferase family A protein [Rhizomicrobium sp.]|nr:glycosyltransferase family A protein [Rhizomicrobium sp.]
MSPFFSVVIPVYNRAAPLEIALRSVLSQSDGDFEVIVIDDGSSDDPNSIVERLGDPRIRFIRQDNRGGGAARNTGIGEAAGRLIAFLDSDDVFLAHHLAAMRRLLSGTTRTAGYARMIVDRGDGRRILKPPRALRQSEDMATYLLCDRGFVPTITTVVPAELAKAILYDEDLREAEDTDFAVRLALAGCRFVMAEEPGALWHDRYDRGRQSAGRSTGRLARWLDTMKPRIPAKAWYGGRGWALAKGIAPRHPLRALGYFVSALVHGCYSPGLAAIVFLQIFLPDRVYRRVADNAIGWLRVGLRPKPPRHAAAPTERPC